MSDPVSRYKEPQPTRYQEPKPTKLTPPSREKPIKKQEPYVTRYQEPKPTKLTPPAREKPAKPKAEPKVVKKTPPKKPVVPKQVPTTKIVRPQMKMQISGKTYNLYRVFSTKERADEESEKIRRYGWNARVKQVGGWYTIYILPPEPIKKRKKKRPRKIGIRG